MPLHGCSVNVAQERPHASWLTYSSASTQMRNSSPLEEASNWVRASFISLNCRSASLRALASHRSGWCLLARARYASLIWSAPMWERFSHERHDIPIDLFQRPSPQHARTIRTSPAVERHPAIGPEQTKDRALRVEKIPMVLVIIQRVLSTCVGTSTRSIDAAMKNILPYVVSGARGGVNVPVLISTTMCAVAGPGAHLFAAQALRWPPD